MGGEPPIICSACGYVLDDPNSEVLHPEDDNPPENPHFKVQIRDDGEERFQCTESGRLASPVGKGDDNIGSDDLSYPEVFKKHHGELPPGMGEGGGPPTNQQENQRSQDREPGGIYDFDEEQSQMDILEETVSNPRYGLNDDHIAEVKSWAEDYDGRLPPGTLEDILKNLQGVQKQTAELIRQRYDVKLNKWVREQSQSSEGPPIGVSAQPTVSPGGNQTTHRTATPTPQQQQESQNQNQEKNRSNRQGRPSRGQSEPRASNLREYRRKRRTRRRQETLDIAAEQAAREAADEIAREMVQQFGGFMDIPRTVLQRKAEKDPDWFLEKAEKMDIDVMSLLEPSEQRKKEMKEEENKTDPEVDNEVDQALQSAMNGDSTVDQTDTEKTIEPPNNTTDESTQPTPDEHDIQEPISEDDETEDEPDDRMGAEMFE